MVWEIIQIWISLPEEHGQRRERVWLSVLLTILCIFFHQQGQGSRIRFSFVTMNSCQVEWRIFWSGTLRIPLTPHPYALLEVCTYYSLGSWFSLFKLLWRILSFPWQNIRCQETLSWDSNSLFLYSVGKEHVNICQFRTQKDFGSHLG